MLSARIFAAYQDAVAEAGAHPGVTELASGAKGEGPWGATPHAFQTSLKEFGADAAVLSRERFGPAGVVITYSSVEELLPVLGKLAGNLVGTVHVDTGSAADIELARQVIPALERIAGRIVYNGWPTGVAVVAAQEHGPGRPRRRPRTRRSARRPSAAGWFPSRTRTSQAELLPEALRAVGQDRAERP